MYVFTNYVTGSLISSEYIYVLSVSLQVRADWYVFAVLSALPWVGRELYEKKEAEFLRLLQTIGNYLRYGH